MPEEFVVFVQKATQQGLSSAKLSWGSGMGCEICWCVSST